MMIQSLFILEHTGEVIIEKHWGSAIDRSVCEYYLAEVEKNGGGRQEIPSVLTTPLNYIFHIERNDLALLCLTGTEMPPLMATEFLVRCADVFAEYFESCSAMAIRSHFVTVYQLLEEMVDSGMPTTTETNILKELIPPPTVVTRLNSAMGSGPPAAAVLPLSGGGGSAVPWRRADCRYANNEIFFDVVEAVDATLDADGRLLSGGVYGEVHAVARLSGMPDLTLTFANSGLLDDVRFHPCVRYARFAADRVLSFVPPDGPCKLMSYKVRDPPAPMGGRGGMMGAVPPLPLPLYVKPQFSFSEASGRISLMIGPRMDMRKPVEGIVVRVPLPVCVASIDVQANHGGVGYDEKSKVILWDLGSIPKDRTPILSGVLQLDRSRTGDFGEVGGGGAVDAATAKAKMLWDEALSIEVSFKVFGSNVSGLSVDALHLVNEQYKLYKGVRYTTMSGRFVVRV